MASGEVNTLSNLADPNRVNVGAKTVPRSRIAADSSVQRIGQPCVELSEPSPSTSISKKKTPSSPSTASSFHSSPIQ